MEDPVKRSSLAHLIGNPFLIAYFLIYVVFLAALHRFEHYELSEPIFLLLVVGIGFSAVAWWLTRRATPLAFTVHHPPSECGVLGAYLIGVSAFITWGLDCVSHLSSAEPWNSLLILISKLMVFVVLPLILFRLIWKYALRNFFDVSTPWRSHLWTAFWMSVLLILFQISFGNGPRLIREAHPGAAALAAGIPFAYLWLIVDVGVVEEFFFRVLLQSRLSALFRSETSGIVFVALLFGLAHAPGLYFRSSKTLEGLASQTSPLMAVGYSIVAISVTGLFLGVLWARTKNFMVLILVHAAADLVPNLVPILKAWHILR